MKLTTITLTGKKNEMETPIFDSVASPKIVAQAVRVFLANQRAGLAKTKTRGEVSMTKKKAYKQKGTGNARHGARSAPIFVGGGVTHGPNGNANWKLTMSKTMRKVALRTAFGMQANAGKLIVVDGLLDMQGKTKETIALLKSVEMDTKAVLIIASTLTDGMKRAMSNVSNVLLLPAATVSTFHVMRAHKILIASEALEYFEGAFSKKDKFAVEEAALKAKAGKAIQEEVVAAPVTKVAKKAVVKKEKVAKEVVEAPAESEAVVPEKKVRKTKTATK